MLRTHYEPWAITFEASNSSQDFNFGVTFTVSPSPESDKPTIEYSDWGKTLDEALEKIAFRIARKETDEMNKIKEARKEHDEGAKGDYEPLSDCHQVPIIGHLDSPSGDPIRCTKCGKVCEIFKG